MENYRAEHLLHSMKQYQAHYEEEILQLNDHKTIHKSY